MYRRATSPLTMKRSFGNRPCGSTSSGRRPNPLTRRRSTRIGSTMSSGDAPITGSVSDCAKKATGSVSPTRIGRSRRRSRRRRYPSARKISLGPRRDPSFGDDRPIDLGEPPVGRAEALDPRFRVEELRDRDRPVEEARAGGPRRPGARCGARRRLRGGRAAPARCCGSRATGSRRGRRPRPRRRTRGTPDLSGARGRASPSVAPPPSTRISARPGEGERPPAKVVPQHEPPGAPSHRPSRTGADRRSQGCETHPSSGALLPPDRSLGSGGDDRIVGRYGLGHEHRDRRHPHRDPRGRHRRHRRPPPSRGRARRARAGRRAGDVRRGALRTEGSPEVDPCRGVPAPRTGTRRGLRRGDGELDQLQHGVDLDLRTPADLRVLEAPRQGERVGQAPRPAVPRDGQRRLGRGAAHRIRGPQLERRRQGDGALQLPRRPGPVGPRRLDDGDEPADLGLRVELRRPRRDRRGEGQPAHAEARPPLVGRGRGRTRSATRPATA